MKTETLKGNTSFIRLAVGMVLLLMLGAILASHNAGAASAKPIEVKYDEKKLSFTPDPILDKGTTLVPFRPLFEGMGMSVKWDKTKQTVTGTKDGLNIVLRINSKQATVNGKTIQLSLAPEIRNGSTLVPLRFVGESTGAYVAWNPYAPEILIYSDHFFKSNGVTKEQVRKAFEDHLAKIKAQVEAEKAANTTVKVPAAPKGSGVYKPASSNSVDLNNLQGMYYGFRPDYDGSECGGMCWDIYTFLPGKKIVTGQPANGGPETINCTKDTCRSYTISGNKLSIQGGSTHTIKKVNGRLVIDDIELEAVKPVKNDQKLSGTYTYRGFSGLIGISGGATSWSTTITFKADGTFESDHMMIGSVNGGAPTTGASGSSTSGSYRITGNTIVLAYRDKTVENELFFIQDGASASEIQIGENYFRTE
ncbi:copper amine oxidase N-terminal domain-containing protein [Paenibacillus lemnae]|uniref:Copper amine oxidase-like N-terminal domain-containing protein n=1 Tax=Paenibacillus lemnae TaxID=1330551 RepID=A0A848MBJ3_PAELE|nr:copper amine oxidase N-terminal domain-containing protein [Paenibacillus lemnae]NMO97609.1 hypothetical protein [Paenibacillus lemnae]